MPFYLSRQCYWGDDEPNVVEIASGGLDYANPDMLSDKGTQYAKLGCGQEYTDPREALAAAIKIRDAWMVAEPDEAIRIECGFTGGNTLPFSDYPTDEELLQWAEKAWEGLEKCERCGEVIVDGKWYYLHELGQDVHFCSEYCADESAAAFYDEEDEEDEDE